MVVSRTEVGAMQVSATGGRSADNKRHGQQAKRAQPAKTFLFSLRCSISVLGAKNEAAR